jgi:hypothetical protein
MIVRREEPVQDALVNVTIPFSRPLAHPIVSLKGR